MSGNSDNDTPDQNQKIDRDSLFVQLLIEGRDKVEAPGPSIWIETAKRLRHALVTKAGSAPKLIEDASKLDPKSIGEQEQEVLRQLHKRKDDWKKPAATDYGSARSEKSSYDGKREKLFFARHGAIDQAFSAGLDTPFQKAELDWKALETPSDAVGLAKRLIDDLKKGWENVEKLHDRLKEVDKLINDAAVDAEKIRSLGTSGAKELLEEVAEARRKFQQAKEKQALQDIQNGFKKWSDRLKTAKQGGGSNLKLLKAYRELRKSVLEQVEKASLLRGDRDMQAQITKARQDVQDGDEKLSDLSTLQNAEAEVNQVLEGLKPHLELLAKAKKLDGELKQKSNQGLDRLPRYEQERLALRVARDKVATMFGTGLLVGEIDKLLADTELKDQESLQKCAQFVDQIKGKSEEYLKEAALCQEEALRKQLVEDPELGKALTEAKQQLDLYCELHSTELGQIQSEMLARVVTTPDPRGAVARLVEQWKAAVQRQQLAKQSLETERKRLDTQMELVRQLPPPEDLLRRMEHGVAEVERLATLSEFSAALLVARNTAEMAEGYRQRREEADRRALQLQQEVAQITQDAQAWADWPPCAQQVQWIQAAVETAWTKFSTQKIELQDLIDTLNRNRKLVDDLAEKAKAIGLTPEKVPDGKRVADQATQEWQQRAELTRQKLAQLAEALELDGAGAGASKTKLHRQFDKLVNDWPGHLKGLPVAEGQNFEEAIATLKQGFLQQLAGLDQDIDEALRGKQQREPLLKEVLESGRQARLRERHASLALRLQQLDSLQVDTSKLWSDLGRVFDPVAAPRLEPTWEHIGVEADKLLKAQGKLLEKEREKGLVLADKLEKVIRETGSAQRELPGLFESMQARTLDARAMLDSEDLTLVAAGLAELKKIGSTLGQGLKGGTLEDGTVLKTFDDLTSLWKELSAQVGHNDLMERLPVTYHKLYAKLNSAVVKAQSLPPHEGWTLLDTLREPIYEAVEQARRVKERYALFKAQVEGLEGKLKKLYDAGGSAKAFDLRFKTRIAEASGLAKQEGQMDAAFSNLKALHEEIDGLLADPSKTREQLQKLDGECAKEQREVRDMARRWKRTMIYWDERLLPAVQEAMLKRGKDEDNSNELTDLKRALKRLATPLYGYLETIAPVTMSAEPAPDIKEARQAFATAYGRLLSLQTTAQRLIDGDASTNVEYDEDLGKLDAEWSQRAMRVQERLEQLVSWVGRFAGEQKATTDEEQRLIESMNQAVKPVQKTIAEARLRLSPTAFTQALRQLQNPDLPQPQRLKAREDALRTMRNLRDEIVDSSLMRQLFEGAAQGLLDVDVRADLGLLRASLKKIELAALVAA